MKFEPLYSRIVVESEEGEEKIEGIFVPDNAKEKPKIGKVVVVGPGKKDDKDSLIPMIIKAGDKVFFGKYAGSKIIIENKEYLIMNEEDVLGVFEE